jgi:uncharacterized delta-60 repeat protein
MKKRLVLLQLFITFVASIADASVPQEYATLSRVYNNRFIPQVNESASIGLSGTLDQTFNNTEGSIGSIDLSAQLAQGSSRAVVALPNSNFLVGMSAYGVNSNLGMYNSEGTLQTSYGDNGIVDLGGNSSMIQTMIQDVQGRTLIAGGTGEESSGWLQRINEDSSETMIFQTNLAWSMIAGLATQSTGKIIAVGSNNSNAMIARYLVDGDIDTTFGTNGYVILDGSGQLPNSTAGIFSVVVDQNDKIYIPYLDTDNTVWIIRLLANGTPDASWFTSCYGGMTRSGYLTTVGNLTTMSSNTAIYRTSSSLSYPSSGPAVFTVGSGSPYYSGTLRTSDNNRGILTISGSFITNRVAVPYLNHATPDQIRMALDVHNNLIIAARVGNVIKLNGVVASNGQSAYLDRFTSSVITDDQLNLSSLLTTQDNSILMAGSNATTGQLAIIKLIGNGIVDTSFNELGYNFFTTNLDATYFGMNSICLSPDGRIYAATYAGIDISDNIFNYPYISRLYNSLYDTQIAQSPATQEQGILDLSFGDTTIQTYPGIINPYFGKYRGNLFQKGQVVLEVGYPMQNGDNSGVGDIFVVTNGYLNNSSYLNYMLNWFTPSGQVDTNFGSNSSGTLLCNNVTSADETINGMVQDADGSIYVVGTSDAGPIVRKYTQDSTSTWTYGNEEWDQTASRYADGEGYAIGLQGTRNVIVAGFDDARGFIVAYDQSTGHIADGTSETSPFGATGEGFIDYNSFSLNMNKIYSIVVNNAGDIFVAYQNTDPGFINVAGFLPDGSALISQFGTNGIVESLFSPFVVNNWNVEIAQANTGNLLVCAADDANIYLARLDGVTGQIDRTFNEGEFLIISLETPNIYQLQGVSDGSILITGSSSGDTKNFTIRVTFDGIIDTTFNAQGSQPGYEFVTIAQNPARSKFKSLAIQSDTGNMVTTGYESLTNNDASPLVSRSFGQPGTTGVMSFSPTDIYPGTLDTSFNDTGALNLTDLISDGSAKIVYAYPSGNTYQGKLLLGIDIGLNSLIARVDETYMTLDTTFGENGIYSADIGGITSLCVDANNNIVIAGIGHESWAQQLSPDAQSSIGFNLPYDFPHNITQINAVGQQKSGRYILVGSDANTDLLIMAFQNQLVDDNNTLQLDTTFNPLGIVAPIGTYIVGGAAGALYNLVINNDDTMLVAYQDTITPTTAVLMAKVLANGSGLDQTFGMAGMIVTDIQADSGSVIKLAIDAIGRIIVAASYNNQEVQVIRYIANGTLDDAWIGSEGSGTPTVITGIGVEGVVVTNVLETEQNQTILLGYNTMQGEDANGPLFAVRLDSRGVLDTTWNPYAVSSDVPGILTYSIENANVMNNACIGISGNVWVAATYQTEGNFPILIEINGDTYVQQVPFSPLASPAGTLDYTLSPSGALNLEDQLGIGVGIPRQLSILPDQSMFIASNYGDQTRIAKLNPILNLDTFNFAPSSRSPHGYVIIDNANSVNDLFVANATGQDGSIYVAGGANVDERNVMWAGIITADGQTVTTVTASNSLDNGCAIRLSKQGQVLVAGHASSTGIIAAFTPDLTSIDTSFGTDGYYTTAVDSVIGAMTVDSQGRIYIAYAVNNELGGTLYVQRILSDGSSLDRSFGEGGTVTVFTSESAYSQTQLFMQLDEAYGYLATAVLDERGQFIQVNRWSMNDGEPLGGIDFGVGATAETNDVGLSHLFFDTHTNIYVVGYRKISPYPTIVARIKDLSGRAIALDRTYAVDGVASVIAGPLSGPGDFSIGSGILDQDGRVYVVGKGGDEQPYMARLFGDNYYQEVNQAVEFRPTPPVGPGSFDETYGTNGIAATYGGGALSGQQARAIVPITTGTNILTVITSQDGLSSWTVRLLSDGTYDPTYGDGQGIAIAQNATGTEVCQGMIFDGQSNAIIFGSNSVAGGYVKNILPTGAMNPSFGTANSGMIYLSQFDLINGVAQLSNGQFVIVGSKSGVGLVGLISLNGTLINSPAIATFGTNVTSVSIDQSDNIYISYAFGSIVVNVAKMSSTFVQHSSYNANAQSVLSDVNDVANIRLALDVNGQIVVAATGNQTAGSVNLIRLNLDGTLDSSFNNGSPFAIMFQENTVAPITSLIALQNGNYLVSGYQYDGVNEDNSDYEFVACINSIGAYDTTFNAPGSTPGLLTFQVAEGVQEGRNLWGMSVQYDGQILLAGSEESLESIDTPLTIRLDGYTDVKSIQQYPGYTPPTPDPINAQFGIAFTGVIPYLVDGGSTAVDSLQRVLVGGRTADTNTLVVARFLQDGTLDPEFNGTGIAQTPELATLSSGFFITVDIVDNVYVAGITTDNTFVLAKFLGTDGSLDTAEFNRDGSIPGVAVSTDRIGKTLASGGYVTIDYLGNVIVGGMTTDSSIVVARFFSDGTIDAGFGPELPGMNVVPVTNLRYGGYVTTNPSLIEEDNSIYVGANTTEDTLLIVKFTRTGDVDTEYGSSGIAQTDPITHLVNGGPVALNYDRKVVIGGFTADKTFVAARFGLDGLFDPTFNGNGISYSNALSSLNSCASICIDSNNNVLLGGTSTAYDGVSISMVVARMTVLGAIDTTLSATGMVTTGTIADLQTGGFVATDALSNIFTGGFDTAKLVVAGLYSGAQIFINNPQLLPAAVFKIFWYGNNPALFKDYLAAEFYAQVIADPVVRAIVVEQVNSSLDEYAAYAQNQLGFNLAASTTPTWDGNLSRLQAVLLIAYPDSTDDINEFFRQFNNRRTLVHLALLAFNNN